MRTANYKRETKETSINVEINIDGENNHHIIESCFKALARSLRLAVQVNEREGNIVPSTKGQL